MRVYEERIMLKLPRSEGRSVGLHISEVIRDYAFTVKALDHKWKTEIAIEDQDTNLMQLGLAYEEYLENSGQIEGLEYHPGELKVRCGFCARCGDDDVDHAVGEYDHDYKELVIYMSPDGFFWNGAELEFLVEIKFTKKTCRDFAQGLRMGSKKSIMWVWQIAAYLKGTGTLAAKLYVMFVNGNYTYNSEDPDGGAVKKCFRLEFSEDEIESNWRMLSNHARRMIRAGRYKAA